MVFKPACNGAGLDPDTLIAINVILGKKEN